MSFSRFVTLSAAILVLFFQLSVANAADRGIFKNKTPGQHELTDREKKKMNAEFKTQFSATKKGAFQKLNNNPWAAKKNRQQVHQGKMLQLSNSWGHCREYSYKQRGQCYARGGDAYTCERYYDARVKHCDDQF
ncbi:MAG: hypothetical protein OQL06_15815 [Gammaproteobacteria bacterium]|nr:hypothetical protein [Gammaproteobacteria bacterium]